MTLVRGVQDVLQTGRNALPLRRTHELLCPERASSVLVGAKSGGDLAVQDLAPQAHAKRETPLPPPRPRYQGGDGRRQLRAPHIVRSNPTAVAMPVATQT